MEWLRSLNDRHVALKKRVHSFRLPLSPRGVLLMQCVYFTIPVVGGWYVMQWAISKSHENIGLRGEKLREGAAGQSGEHARGTSIQNAALQAQLRQVAEQAADQQKR